MDEHREHLELSRDHSGIMALWLFAKHQQVVMVVIVAVVVMGSRSRRRPSSSGSPRTAQRCLTLEHYLEKSSEGKTDKTDPINRATDGGKQGRIIILFQKFSKNCFLEKIPRDDTQHLTSATLATQRILSQNFLERKAENFVSK